MATLTILASAASAASAAAEGADTAHEAVDATLFYVVGLTLAVFAVIVSIVGIKKDGFPGGTGPFRALVGLSTLLAVGAAASAIIVST